MINCKQCANKSICKFIGDANILKENVSKLSVPAFSPIKIDISCDMFKDDCCTKWKSWGNTLSQHEEHPITEFKSNFQAP